jgi:hypothetical protein
MQQGRLATLTCTEKPIIVRPPHLASEVLAVALVPGDRTVTTSITLPVPETAEIDDPQFHLDADGIKVTMALLGEEKTSFVHKIMPRLIRKPVDGPLNGRPLTVVFGLDEPGFLLYEVVRDGEGTDSNIHMIDRATMYGLSVEGNKVSTNALSVEGKTKVQYLFDNGGHFKCGVWMRRASFRWSVDIKNKIV